MSITSTAGLQQLEELKNKCVAMGAIIGAPTLDSPQSYFTAMAPEQGLGDSNESSAKMIQQKIARAAQLYPDVVFYRFDSFSSLLYII